MLTGPSPLGIARLVIDRQPERSRLVAALVKGSSGELGYVPPGGDIDLVLWVDGSGPRHAELEVDGVPVELFVRPRAELLDVEAILRHQAQPFELMAGLVIHDPRGVIDRARAVVGQRLCEPGLIAGRAGSSAGATRSHLAEAVSRTEAGNWPAAASAASIALWHLAAVAPGGSCVRPTTRRCFALLARLLLERGRADLADLAARALGARLDARRLVELAGSLRPADRRVPAAVAGMLEAEEEAWAVYPILRSAFGPGVGHAPEVVVRVAAECGWDERGLPRRLSAASRLLGELEGLFVRPPSSDPAPTA